MARVTVEDCIDKVTNRFELVLLAGHRSRTISSGAPITVDRDNDKNPVIALREIAEQTVSPEDLKEGLIHSMQKHVEIDEPEKEAAPMLPHDRHVTTAQVFGAESGLPERKADSISEDDLLRGLTNLTPPDSSSRRRR